MKKEFFALCCVALSASATAQQTTVRVDLPWVRATAPGQTSAGLYLTIESKSTDRLLAASTPIAESTQIHSMRMDGNIMRMEKLEALDLPAGQKVALQPGGLHIMLVGIKTPLKAGSSIPLSLKFEKAGEVKTSALIQTGVPAKASDDQHMHH